MGFSAGKRKSRDEEDDYFPMDDLSNDILERVLSWLPTSCFFRMSSVCKRWKSCETSQSFKLACSQIPYRDPWFYMIGSNDSDSDSDSGSSFVFDSSENNWKDLSRRNPFLHRRGFIPVASSGGLLCFRCSISGEFLVRNPLTGSSRDLPSPISQDINKPLQAVAMTTVTPSCYKLVTISGEIPNLSFRIYESSSDSWSKNEALELVKNNTDDSSDDDDDTGTVYFLTKSGDVVVASHNLQRTPSKQYSSVIDNAGIVYFLSSYGTIIACDLTKRCFNELPELLPSCQESSLDLVVCNGTMFVIVLSEFYESASLRIWKLENQNWIHVSMLPPAMSHELYVINSDINCVGGAGNKILVCFNSDAPDVHYRYFVYDLVAEEWSELPRCFKDGEAVDFVSALSFQPRIEATV